MLVAGDSLHMVERRLRLELDLNLGFSSNYFLTLDHFPGHGFAHPRWKQSSVSTRGCHEAKAGQPANEDSQSAWVGSSPHLQAWTPGLLFSATGPHNHGLRM